MNRQVAVTIERSGKISHVIVGDASSVFIPEMTDYPLGKKVLRGLRFIHTHLKNEPLTKDDLTDLALLRFDYIAALGVKDGLPDKLFGAYLMPSNVGVLYEVEEPVNFYNVDRNFAAFIESLEEEMHKGRSWTDTNLTERAILVSVSPQPKYELEDSMDELCELCRSGDIEVIDTVIQRAANPRYLLGMGKLKELIIEALNKGATMLVFDQDLSPSQGKAISDLAELKVIDRSQLILDIFAHRAHSRDGKVQVELAQLKYRLPRLIGKGTAMSRLTGGIGGRGPGEMKLEIDRRRVRDRITLLTKELEKLSLARTQRKHRRAQSAMPIISIVGYTNAGKSTLLNNLTESSTFTEEKMFATLDTASRRLRFPRQRDVIMTDTVGFIRDLPQDLVAAFKSTLEELEDADLLLHLVDISNPRFEKQMASVENTLHELNLSAKETLLVFNKTDRVPQIEVDNLVRRFDAVAVSAIDNTTFRPLMTAMEERIFFKTPKKLKYCEV
ncbi:GTPase HflX [Candidatus Magnetomonas plexicatena]|uniref:GTPase HflX n=1 Tax=Candidatus Magnetomonas plexicatena TaxID=2552947 RepID=UPI004032FE03